MADWSAAFRTPRPGLRDRLITPVLVGALVLTVLIVLFLTAFLLDSNRRQAQNKFDNQADQIQRTIQSRFDLYSGLLSTLQGGFAVKNTPMTRDQYHELIQYADIPHKYPGLSAVSFVQHVAPENLEGYIDAVRQDTSLVPGGYPNFGVRPEGVRPDSYIVTYPEPNSASSSTMGLDLASDSGRYATISLARDTGTAQSSGLLTPLAANSAAPPGTKGFSVYAPIYQPASPHGTVEERRANIMGIISAGFRAETLFSGILHEAGTEKTMAIGVYDGKTRDKNSVLYTTNANGFTAPAEDFTKTTQLNFAGKSWTLALAAPPTIGLSTLDRFAPAIVLVVGLLVSLLLIALLWGLAESRAHAVSLANEITAELRESELKYRLITQNSQELIGLISSSGTLEFASLASQKLLGRKPSEVVGRDIRDLVVAEDRPAVADAIKRMSVGTAHSLKLEYRMKTAGRSSVWVEALWQAVTRDGRTVIQVSSRDIGERKAIEADLRRQADELERLNRAMVGRELKMVELKQKLSPKEPADA